MPGLLYPAYQKFYSAISCLERFRKEQDFFENISCLDTFFSEYRSITLVMQKSLAHTPYIDTYTNLVATGCLDPWLNKQRVKSVHTHPVEFIKQVDISIYFSDRGIDLLSESFSVEDDVPLSSLNDALKAAFARIDPTEVFFSAKCSFPEKDTGEDVLKLQTIFRNNELEISDPINKCVEIISELTNYTSIVLGKNSIENNLQQVNIIPISDTKIVALVCTDKGIVENKQFTLENKEEINEIVKTSEIINKMLVGTPIQDVSKRLEFEIKPIISRQIKQYEMVYNIFADAFNDFLNKGQNIHFGGKTKIFDEPEYNDALEIKRLASKFEDKNFIKRMEESSNDGNIKIYIGEENDFDPNVTIIKSKYKLNGEEGTIAIVGPKRMEYDRVVGLLEYIKDELNDDE